MAIDTVIVRFAPDGSATAHPDLAITPGVDVIWDCEAQSGNGVEAHLTDLRNAFLVMEISNSVKGIVLWQEDAPLFDMHDPQYGNFKVRLTPEMTAFIPPGSYTLEIKARFLDGTRKRIAYIQPMTVGPSGLATDI